MVDSLSPVIKTVVLGGAVVASLWKLAWPKEKTSDTSENNNNSSANQSTETTTSSNSGEYSIYVENQTGDEIYFLLFQQVKNTAEQLLTLPSSPPISPTSSHEVLPDIAGNNNNQNINDNIEEKSGSYSVAWVVEKLASPGLGGPYILHTGSIQLVIQDEESTPINMKTSNIPKLNKDKTTLSYTFGTPISVDPGDSYTFSWTSSTELPSLTKVSHSEESHAVRIEINPQTHKRLSSISLYKNGAKMAVERNLRPGRKVDFDFQSKIYVSNLENDKVLKAGEEFKVTEVLSNTPIMEFALHPSRPLVTVVAKK